MSFSGVLILSALCSSSGPASELERTWAASLDREIASLKTRFKGRVSAYVKDLELGVEYRYDAEAPSYLASGVKVPFMIEVYRQAHQGLLSLDETIVYRVEDERDGAPRLRRVKPGTAVPIRELVLLMIQHSDNAASDMLVRRVGIHNVNAGLAAHGLDGFSRITSLLDVRRAVFRELDYRGDDLDNLEVRDVRWTWGWQAHVKKLESTLGRPSGTHSIAALHEAYERYYATGVNHARVDAVGRMMEKMVQGELVSPAASAEMLGIMRGSQTSDRRMLGKLPRGVRTAHKTGSQFERICDYGVMDLPKGSALVFAACVAGGNDRNLAESTLASVARKAYDLAAAAPR